MEKIIGPEQRGPLFRRALVAVGLGTGILALSGCAEMNYTGEGNEFVVRGEVVATSSQSITAEVIHVEDANGWAAYDEWFANTGGTEEFHDNCDCHGFWNGRKQYGELYDGSETINPDSLDPGTCVEFIGAIRTDSDGKVWHERPVYEQARVIDCGL